MSKMEDFVECDTCGASLDVRFWSFDRLVQRFDYDRQGDTPDDCATVTVLRDEMLGQFCDDDCARLTALPDLAERGLKLVECGAGPIETCAKCGGPVDLTEPHVFYQLMDQTVTHKPWLSSVQPHDTEALAYVCPRCDGDLTADEMNVPETMDESRPVDVSAVVHDAESATVEQNEEAP
jgi:ssDNA-binding Zn-finger/Zn-ribbon topoisomerase 1